LDNVARAADHLAIAALQAPDASAGADVDILDSLRLELLGAADIVDVVGIAAIDQDIAPLQLRGERLDGGIDSCRRNHHPDGPRRGQFFDHVIQRGCALGSFAGQSIHIFLMVIRDDALVLGSQEATGHIRAHSPESDHSELHVWLLLVGIKSRHLRRCWHFI
jgi:hypothetical protein